jgi:hypothetical protein
MCFGWGKSKLSHGHLRNSFDFIRVTPPRLILKVIFHNLETTKHISICTHCASHSPKSLFSSQKPKALKKKTQIGREMVRRKNQAVRAPQKAENGETLIVSEIERRTKIARLFSLLHALGRSASLFWFK